MRASLDLSGPQESGLGGISLPLVLSSGDRGYCACAARLLGFPSHLSGLEVNGEGKRCAHALSPRCTRSRVGSRRVSSGRWIVAHAVVSACREEFSLTLQVHRPAPKAGAAGLEGSSSRGADRKAGFSMLAKERQAKTGQATSLQEALDRTCSATLLEEGFMSGADAAGGGATQTKVLDRDDERSGASANLCAVEKTKCSLVVWDLAGGEGLETRWRAMQEKCDAVVYAVDSTMFAGMERSPVKQRALEEARREILALFYEEYFVLHKDVKFLVLANKQDLRSAASASHILELLDLPEDLQSRLHILPCSAVSGEGLLRGLEWLASSAQCPCFSARDADRSVASTCDSWWHSAAAAAPKLSVDGKASAEMSGGRTVSRGESDQSPKEEQPIPAAGRGLPGSREVVQGAGRGGDSAEGTAAGAKHATARLTCADSAARKTGAGRGNAAVVDLLDDQQELQTGTEFAQKNASPVDIPADLDW
ncbi:hypothetical protein BESB_021590 [Besnoitia besnoiti]|uniref:ADP-ribosylation factor family protein n=1 Tax=Besnoitia besnoiti TaxID=94643 RepID=A0A2A9M0Z1_BESBE|nr:hypothetical protein BESB_021590 [Besnoitia besnoiti]PFH32218.1 hypothetical protein BESB_021590 [Besnoitia besnoiti]